MSFPIPTGVTASFANVVANTNTATFSFPEGLVIVTFQPADLNDAGTMTLYDSAATSILTMTSGGWATHRVPIGGASYYFSCTKPVNIVAMTRPNNPERY